MYGGGGVEILGGWVRGAVKNRSGQGTGRKIWL